MCSASTTIPIYRHPAATRQPCLKALYKEYAPLRMIYSEDEDLDRRLEEYGRHLTATGWKYKTAKERLVEGAKKDRKTSKPAQEKE